MGIVPAFDKVEDCHARFDLSFEAASPGTEQSPFTGNSFQIVRSSIKKNDVRIRNLILHTVRHQYFIRGSRCCDSCPNMDRQPYELFSHVEAFTGVNPDPHLEPERFHASEYGESTVNRFRRMVETTEKAIPGGRKIASAEELMLSSNERVVGAHDLHPIEISHLCQELGGSDYIAK
jgi:hypothetical protein